MGDSDDEIFWGPLTVRELQIIRQQIFPTDLPENKETEEVSELDSSQELNNTEKAENNNFTSDSPQSENFNDKDDDKKLGISGNDLQVQDDPLSNVRCIIPKIVISDDCNIDWNDPRITTITSTASNNHDISDRATDDGYGSVVVESFIHENDSVSQSSDIPIQSLTKACESVMSLSNCEVPSEDIVPSPEEKHTCLNDKTTKHSRSDSNAVVMEHDSSSLNISVGGTCNSMECHLSNLQKTSETDENYVDSCKSAFASISSSPYLTTDCSVDTHFSKSIESSLSNDYDSLPFKFPTVSLNCTESQSQDGDDAVCERGASENDQTLTSHSNCEAISDEHSILSNLISEMDPQHVSEKSNFHISTCLSELNIKDNHLNPVFNNNINDKSTDFCNVNVDNVIIADEECNSPSNGTGACSSKIPVLQKSASGSSKKRDRNVKSNSSKCCGDGYRGYFPNSHPFLIPVSPVSYDINTDNLVTRSPNGHIIPTACSGSSVQTSISANYVHVMTSEKISELAKNGFFMKSSPCAKEVSTSGRRLTSESEDSEAFNIESESGSVLCSSSFDSNSSRNDKSLNNTLEEMEMMIKHGYDYMCSKDDLILNQDSETGLQSNAMPLTVPKSEPEQKPTHKGLKQCQYIRASREEIKPSTFRKEFKDVYADAVRTPVLNTFTQKPASAVCPRQLQRLKKTINFSNIRSPVGAYIKDRPVHLLKTAGKVKPCGRDDIPSKMFEKEFVGSSAKQMPFRSVPTLPEIVYEKAPGISVNQTRATERCGPSKKNYATPTIIKHAGRAVLATVPQNALQMINTEISVLYDKDVSKTATL